MIEQYLPNLWRVGGGSWGVGATVLSLEGDGNVYLLKGPDGAALVDCGRSAESLAPLVDNLREAGVSPDDLTDLILTHSHCDHSWAASKWQQQYGVRVHLNAVGADWLARGDRRLIGSPGPDSGFEPLRVDQTIDRNSTPQNNSHHL